MPRNAFRILTWSLLAGTCASWGSWNLAAQTPDEEPFTLGNPGEVVILKEDDTTGKATVDSAPVETPVPNQAAPRTDAPLIPKVEVVRPGRRVGGNPDARNAPLQDDKVFRPSNLTQKQLKFLQQSSVERERAFLNSEAIARKLETAADDVFSRGLLPVFDYADQRQSALEVKLSVADLRGDRAARAQALIEHADAMQSAVEQYEKFNQPASNGWMADLTYAKLLSARANGRLAEFRGHQDLASVQYAQAHELAQEHLEIRKQEYEVGSASLSQYLRAARETINPAGGPLTPEVVAAHSEQVENYQRTLRELLPQVQQFAALDAGVGRKDLVTQVEYELAAVSGWKALYNDEVVGAESEFGAAYDSAQELTAQQLEFYETGTAHLSDLIRTWREDFLLRVQTQNQNLVPSDDLLAVQGDQYAVLTELAEELQDRTGRNTSDVLHLEALGALDGLLSRQLAQKAMQQAELGAPRPVPGTTPRSGTTPRTKVQNIRPDGTAENAPAPKVEIIRGRSGASTNPAALKVEVKPRGPAQRSNGQRVLEIQPAPSPAPQQN